MAAYAAAVSLMHIIDLIENHPSPPISLDRKQVDSLTDVVTFLQEFLEGYVSPFSYSDEADPLEMRIADAVYAAEDVIESYLVDNIHLSAQSTTLDDDDDDKEGEDSEDSDRFNSYDEEEEEDDDDDGGDDDAMKSFLLEDIHLGEASTTDDDDDDDDDDDATESFTLDRILQDAAPSTEEDDEDIQLLAAAAHHEDEQIRYINFFDGLQKVIEAMDLIKKEAMEIVREKDGLLAAEVQRNVSVEAASKYSSIEMVGFEDEVLELKERLVGGESNRHIIPIVGMGGIGKTTLARNVFAHKLIKEHFDICLWATISQDHNIEQTLRQVLSQTNLNSSGEQNVAELGEELHKYLFGRRYLVVMDDMWSIEVWDKMRFFFPDCGERSRVVVTTRMSNLAAHLTDSSNSLCKSFMNEFDSWTLFSKTVFGSEGSVAAELREIGERIVGKCKGLPLSIAVIGGLLARSERTQGYWEYIEENLSSIVNLENEEYCLRVLKLSYNHLPAYLKPCFLYMGVFDEDSEIKVSTIIQLWVSEGFVKQKKKKNLETIAREYFQELVDRNLLLAHDVAAQGLTYVKKYKDRELGLVGMTKLCRMHDLVRDLSLREAQKQRFYHVYSCKEHNNSWSGHPHRRNVVPNKTLGGVSRSQIMLEVLPVPRSYVYHDHRVKIFPNFRLLRTLHTNSKGYGGSHAYSQKDVFRLVNARLLAVCVDKDERLHSSMSRLWSLHTLIVYSRDANDLEGPVEFWEMHQLKHVEFTKGRLRLQLPPPDNVNNIVVIMENLHTLIGMKDFHLNEDVVSRIPNLRILDVSYVRLMNREVHCLSYLRRLSKLESLRCSIEEESGETYMQTICFPHSLNQIHLESYGVLDDVLTKIGRLPLVEELVIDGGFFRGSKWETVEGQFPRLKNLELWCRSLKKWIVFEASHFPLLQKLILVGFIELEEVPLEIAEIATLETLELILCSESVVLSAKKIVEEQEDSYGEEELSFRVRVEVDDGALFKSFESTPNFQVVLWEF